MIERYTLPAMREVWTEENKFRKWLEIELAACEAWYKIGVIPKKSYLNIKRKAKFNIKRINEIEKEVDHDVIAFIINVAEEIGKDARYFHLGLTSSDVVDTALSILLRDSGNLILNSLKNLSKLLFTIAFNEKETLMVGRTHGVHAEPFVFGLKLLNWHYESERNIKRLKSSINVVSYGKISGPVGNYSNLDPYIEKYVCEKVGLTPSLISSQILQRDRHAEFISTLAIIGSSIEKIALEIRNLQRTEILELEEPFSKKQKGSSAMPHKKNPITCERICGLSRLLRGNSIAAMENIALWHERDITHSSVERVILPDSCMIVYYMLEKIYEILKNLKINRKRMQKNIDLTKGLIFSHRVLLYLVGKGLSRENAYSLVQDCAMKVWNEDVSFKEALLKRKEIKKLLTQKDINDLFDINYYKQKTAEIFSRFKKK